MSISTLHRPRMSFLKGLLSSKLVRLLLLYLNNYRALLVQPSSPVLLDSHSSPRLEIPRLESPGLESPGLESPRLESPEPDSPQPSPQLRSTGFINNKTSYHVPTHRTRAHRMHTYSHQRSPSLEISSIQ